MLRGDDCAGRADRMGDDGIITACTPREDVLTGGLTDKHFAAQLDQVVANAPGYESYADADRFFDLTYPTRGLRDLLAGTFARLGAPSRPPPPR